MLLGASPTTSPAPPISAPCWCAAACAPCRSSACREPAPVPDADAVVVALKSRTAPVRQAVAESLAALALAAGGGRRQFFFKYCSTFDSTDARAISARSRMR